MLFSNRVLKFLFFTALFFFFLLGLAVFFRGLLNNLEKTDALGEWLINFQGGFVRRGILGELLYKGYLFFGANPVLVLKVVSILFILWISALVLFVFKQIGIPYYYIVFPLISVTLFYYQPYFSGFRKDPIQLVLVFYSLSYLKKYLDQEKISFLIIWQFLLILGLFIHEAFLFYAVGIQVLLFLLAKESTFSWRILRKIGVLFPIFLAVILNFTQKGNELVASQIWNSWGSLFQKEFGPNASMYDYVSLKGLTWSLNHAVGLHLDINFIRRDSLGVPAFSYIFPVLFVMLYVYSTVKFRAMEASPKTQFTAFVCIWLTVLVCMLPLFTVLSCDFARLFTYLNISSLFVFYFFSTYFVGLKSPLNMLNPFAKWIANFYDHPRMKWMYNPVVFILIVFFFLTYSNFGFQTYTAFDNSIAGRLLQKIFSVWEKFSNY